MDEKERFATNVYTHTLYTPAHTQAQNNQEG